MAITFRGGMQGQALPATAQPSFSRPCNLNFVLTDVVDPADWCVSVGKSAAVPATHAGLSPVTDRPLSAGYLNINLRQDPVSNHFTITVADPGFDLASQGFAVGDHLWLAFFTLAAPVSGSVPAATVDLGLVVA